MSQKVIRKLTTILAADAQAFSTAMTRDEMGTYAELQAARDVFFKLIARHGGRVANTAGDGLIADFPSVVEAVHCSIEVQQELASRANALPFRIGIHLGDVICDGDDLIGEGVNLAARLQTMADAGGVLISQQVYDQVRNKLSIGFEFLGEKRPRNMVDDIPIYRLTLGPSQNAQPSAQPSAQAAPNQTSARQSQVAQVWNDPDLDSASPARKDKPIHERLKFDTQSETRADNALTPHEKQRRLRFAGVGIAAIVAVNILSGGKFWLAWPILSLAGLYALKNGEALLGRSHLYGIRLKLWTISAFLVCVNLMSWSGTPWAIWPVGAMFTIGFLKRVNSAD